MQIQLKQKEIEIALKDYIVQQGIVLSGKAVTIAFTAGRKDTGLSAEMIIDDSDIPGFSGDGDELPEDVSKPAPVVHLVQTEAIVGLTPEEVPAAPEVVETPDNEEIPAIKTNSLFS